MTSPQAIASATPLPTLNATERLDSAEGPDGIDVEAESAAADGDVGANRRAKRRAFRRDEILRTALDLVTEGGLDAVTTTELAKRTGAALGALYRFFPSKAAVIAALQASALENLSADLCAAVAEASARAESSPARVRALAPIIAMADLFFAQHAREPARYRLIDEVMSKPTPLYDSTEAGVAEAAVQPLLTQVYELAATFTRESGGVVDAHLQRFPMALWGALHGATHFIKRDRLVDDNLQSRRVAGSLVRVLLKGLGANNADVDAAAAIARPSAIDV
ncbi:MAG TPA: helix-turn-helix domain-containing protein [Myxococcota bacterium]